jgi:3-deoxy-D-manno-octulosonic-acid transferase
MTCGRREKQQSEDEIAIQAWEGELRKRLGALLVLAPRHPDRFSEVGSQAMEFRCVSASEWGDEKYDAGLLEDTKSDMEIVLLDTIGDLAAVYGVADVAFVGGSLVARGGHNPLEPAQFGVPVVMGPSYENFREVVGKLIEADGIRIVQDDEELEAALVDLLSDRVGAKAMAERGRAVFEAQSGATGRAVTALVGLLQLTSGEVQR